MILVETTDTAALLAVHHDGFKLFHRLDHGDAEWRSLKLVLIPTGEPPPHNKRNWHLGWNGERLARTRDARLLYEQHPAVADWLIAELQRKAFAATEAIQNKPQRETAPVEIVEPVAAAPVEHEPVETPEQALARAREDSRRWNEQQEAKRQALEAERARERDECAAWRASQLTGHIMSGAFGATRGILNPNRSTTLFESLPSRPFPRR